MSINKVIKNISYSFTANMVSLFLGILATLIFPKFLNIAGYGYYQLYIFYTGYTAITALGISDGVQLKIAGKDYSDLDFKHHNSIFWFSSAMQAIIYIVLAMFVLIFIKDENKKIIYIMDCMIGLITHPYYYLRNILQATDRLKKYSRIVITERSISIVISIVAILLGCRNFIFMIIFDVMGRFISFGIAIGYCSEIVMNKPQIDKDVIRKVVDYTKSGIMILFAVQTSSIVIGVNRYGIEHYWGIEQFSKISLAIALSNMALRCVNSVSVVMFPTLRNINSNKLPEIYKKINVLLISTIFIGMCLFKPACHIIGLWLPQYADTLKCSILLLPICVYECKYSLLINTNLKNLNKEKLIGKINLLSVITSFITAFFSIYILNNIELSIIGILISLSIRSIIGELFIGKLFNIKVIVNIISEMILSTVFVLCNYYINTIYSACIYFFCVLIYLFLNRYELINIIKNLKRN